MATALPEFSLYNYTIICNRAVELPQFVSNDTFISKCTVCTYINLIRH